MTADVVADFAALHMSRDNRLPIRPAAHHWLWLRLLCNTEIRKLMIIAPPESAKTTWVLAYLACSIGWSPEMPRLIGCASGPVATTRSQAVRTLVESAEFRATFPTVRRARGMDYEQDRWSVAPDGIPHAGRIHPTLAAYGAKGAITGSRAGEALADDVHDEENSRTDHQRNLVHLWLHRSFLSRVMAGIGRSIVIGTAWHHDDAYARLRAEGDWVVCHTPLLSEGPEVWATITYPDAYSGERLGEPVGIATVGGGGGVMPTHRVLVHRNGPALWPEHRPLSEVLALQATTPATVWSGTYQGTPTPPGGYVFRREWWGAGRRYGANLDAPVARWISVDTAMSDKDTSDYTAMGVLDLGPDYRLRVRFALAERLAFPDLIQRIEALAAQWNSDGLLQAVIIEDRVSGTSAIQTLARSANPWLAPLLVGFTPTTDKVTRYNQAGVWCHLGCVLLPEPGPDAPWLFDFESQLFSVPQAAHDDLADMFAQGVLYLENIIESGYRSRAGAA